MYFLTSIGLEHHEGDQVLSSCDRRRRGGERRGQPGAHSEVRRDRLGLGERAVLRGARRGGRSIVFAAVLSDARRSPDVSCEWLSPASARGSSSVSSSLRPRRRSGDFCCAEDSSSSPTLSCLLYAIGFYHPREVEVLLGLFSRVRGRRPPVVEDSLEMGGEIVAVDADSVEAFTRRRDDRRTRVSSSRRRRRKAWRGAVTGNRDGRAGPLSLPERRPLAVLVTIGGVFALAYALSLVLLPKPGGRIVVAMRCTTSCSCAPWSSTATCSSATNTSVSTD